MRREEGPRRGGTRHLILHLILMEAGRDLLDSHGVRHLPTHP